MVVKNKIKTLLVQSEVNVLNKVISLAFFEYLGDIELINSEGNEYETFTVEEITQIGQHYIDFDKANILVYESQPDLT